MYKPCSFERKEYLSCYEVFEDGDLGRNDVDGELSEFNDDPIDLAVELAHTRYALAKAEVTIEKIRSGFVRCTLVELDFENNLVAFKVPSITMDSRFHAGSVLPTNLRSFRLIASPQPACVMPSRSKTRIPSAPTVRNTGRQLR